MMTRFFRTRLLLGASVMALLLPVSAGLAQEAGFAVELAPPVDSYFPMRVNLRVFGPVSEPASGFVRGCQGQVMAEDSGALFEVTGRMESLAFTAVGEGLQSMVLATPDGLYRCALADERGFVSTSLAAVAPGRYRVWLGAAEGTAIDAQLIASDRAVSSVELLGLDVARLGEPRNGSLAYAASAESGRQMLLAGATLYADEEIAPLSPGNCWGFSRLDAADLVLTLEAATAEFSVFAESERDMVLAVVDPSGAVHCNDDAYNLNPAVTLSGAEPGDYHIFAGGYGPGEGSYYDLYASEGGPAFTQANIDTEAAPRQGRVSFDVDAAGRDGQLLVTAPLATPVDPVDALPLTAYCAGYVDASAPDLVLTLDAAQPMISLYARSETDLVLAVRAPDGSWSCNDDAFQLNPGISLTEAQAGDYLVYVGAYMPEASGSYNLYASMGEPNWPATMPGGGFTAPASLNTAAEPAVGRLDFGRETRIDPRVIFDIRPSQTEAFGMGDGCAGFITPSQPDLVVHTTEGLPQLMVYMVSDADGTLVIAGPDGRLYCNDDFELLHPGVMIPNPQPGDYAVFAGSYNGNGGVATLGVTIASPHWVMDREH